MFYSLGKLNTSNFANYLFQILFYLLICCFLAYFSSESMCREVFYLFLFYTVVVFSSFLCNMFSMFNYIVVVFYHFNETKFKDVFFF